MKIKQELLVQPSGDIWKNIREELKENVNTRDRDVATIREWLKKQPHLPDDWGKLILFNINPNLDCVILQTHVIFYKISRC